MFSGGGTDFQAVIDGQNRGAFDGRIVVSISSNDQAYGIERAKAAGIPCYVCKRSDYGGDCAARDRAVLDVLKKYDVELIVLAGYLGILSDFVLDAYPRAVINIHPSLLPKFGGDGMYGINVHRAVIAAGEKKSGATVHYVVHDKDTLSLIATHEVAHQLTQLMYAQGQISPWQSELISDKWMGFRAAAEGLDIEKVIHTFDGLGDCETHPGQDLRERHMRQAYDTYNNLSRNGVDLNFNVLMDTAMSQINADTDIRPREIVAQQNALANGGNVMSYSWTQSEIDSHIR